MILRKMNKEVDIKRIFNFDTSFSTKHIYRITVNKMLVEITTENLDAPFQKTYKIDDIKNDIHESDYAVAAEIDKIIVGFATVKYEKWNMRAVLSGIFVSPESKGKGIGTALIYAVMNYLKTTPARILWVETQNVNYPAIQFYIKTGFQFCGFDNTLYNPDDMSTNETAFYFSQKVVMENSK